MEDGKEWEPIGASSFLKSTIYGVLVKRSKAGGQQLHKEKVCGHYNNMNDV